MDTIWWLNFINMLTFVWASIAIVPGLEVVPVPFLLGFLFLFLLFLFSLTGLWIISLSAYQMKLTANCALFYFALHNVVWKWSPLSCRCVHCNLWNKLQWKRVYYMRTVYAGWVYDILNSDMEHPNAQQANKDPEVDTLMETDFPMLYQTLMSLNFSGTIVK